MAEAIGDQDRDTPDDDKIRQAAADGEGPQRLTHGHGDKNEAKVLPNPASRAQSQDTSGDALNNDQRMENRSVEYSGTKTERREGPDQGEPGTPVDAPVPAEEK